MDSRIFRAISGLSIAARIVIADHHLRLPSPGRASTTIPTSMYRFRTPDGQMLSALNWQRGITAAHRVPEGAAIGPWTVIGVWAHQDSSDHSSDFAAISATITVTPF
jgi:hypothetical protein